MSEMKKGGVRFKSDVRDEILKRDNYQCQLNLLFGITELTGVKCSSELEAHHTTYKRAWNHKEKAKDGITVCKRCHEILTDSIRKERYTQKNYTLKNVKQSIPKFKPREVLKDEKVSMQNYRNNTPSNAPGWFSGSSG